jgi:hypothetical protein
MRNPLGRVSASADMPIPGGVAPAPQELEHDLPAPEAPETPDAPAASETPQESGEEADVSEEDPSA